MDELRDWLMEFFMNIAAEIGLEKIIAFYDLDHNGEFDSTELKRFLDRSRIMNLIIFTITYCSLSRYDVSNKQIF